MHQYRINIPRFLQSCLAAAALFAMAACGGSGSSNSNNNTPQTSGFKRRVVVLNSFFGTGVILNGDNDLVWPSPISTISNSTGLQLSPDKKHSLVYSAIGTNLTVIDNTTEQASATAALPAGTESVAVLADNKTAVAAVRNAPITNQPTGAVVVFDITTATVANTIALPLAHYISTNNAGTKILAFADESDTAYVIDTTAATATPIADPTGKLSRPVAAVFTSDGSKAYILSCGAECGGGTPSVTIFNPTDNSLGATLPVNGATIGLIDGTKLYVAGSPANVGQLDVIDTGTFTRTQQGIAIFNGYHTAMAVVDGGKLYVGSRNCTLANDGKGCLSIVNGTSVVNPVTRSPGAVTAIQPLIGRNRAWVTIGGELIGFDTTQDAPGGDQLDIVGNASFVKQID